MSTQFLFVAALKTALSELPKSSRNVTAVVLCQNQFYSIAPWGRCCETCFDANFTFES